MIVATVLEHGLEHEAFEIGRRAAVTQEPEERQRHSDPGGGVMRDVLQGTPHGRWIRLGVHGSLAGGRDSAQILGRKGACATWIGLVAGCCRRAGEGPESQQLLALFKKG